MTNDKKPSIYSDRSSYGSAEELDEYGVWVKSEPQVLSAVSTDSQKTDDFSADLDDAALSVEDSLAEDSSSFEEIDFPGENAKTGNDFNIDSAEDLQDPSFGSEDSLDAELDSGFDDFSVSDNDAALGGDFGNSDFEVPTVKKIEKNIDSIHDEFDSAGGSELSTQLLHKIANELSSIRSELTDLKKEFSVVRSSAPAGKKQNGEDDEHSGFFNEEDDEKIALTGDEMNNILGSADSPPAEEEAPMAMTGDDDDDETIALTGDELDNILNTADFTEEAGAEETPENDLESDFPAFPEEENKEPPASTEEEASSVDETSLSDEDLTLPDEASLADNDLALPDEASFSDEELALPEEASSSEEAQDDPMGLDDINIDISADDTTTDDIAIDDTAMDDISMDDIAMDDLAIGDTATDDIAIDDMSMDDLAIGDITTEDLGGVAEETSEEAATDEIAKEPETPAEASDEALGETDISSEASDDDFIDIDAEDLGIDLDPDKLLNEVNEIEEEVTEEASQEEEAPHEETTETAETAEDDPMAGMDNISFDGGDLDSLDMEASEAETQAEASPDAELEDTALSEDAITEDALAEDTLSEDTALSDTASDDEIADVATEDSGLDLTDMDSFDMDAADISADDIPQDVSERDSEELEKLREEGATPVTPPPENSSYLEEDANADVHSESLDLSEAVIDEPELSTDHIEDTVTEPSLDDISNVEFDMDSLDDLSIDTAETESEPAQEEEAPMEAPAEEPAVEEEEIPVETQEAVEDTQDIAIDVQADDDLTFDEDITLDFDEPAVSDEAASPVNEEEITDKAIDESFDDALDIPVDSEEEAPPVIAAPTAKAVPTQAVATPQQGSSDGKQNFQIPSELKTELRNILTYMDQLLESLPETKIEEFAKSEYFDSYKKLFKELGLV